MKTSYSDPIEQYIDENRMLKKPEVQRLLNVSRSTLARRVKNRQFLLPAVIQNGRSLWRFKDVQLWLSRNLSR
jgi:predicted DNA-binding transcriptional regulator AlpA